MTSTGVLSLVVATLGVGCTDPEEEARLQYDWDDRAVLCSRGFDDYRKPVGWKAIDEDLEEARAQSSVALLHAHDPGATVSIATLEELLDRADAQGLEYVTYDQLVPTQKKPAIAIAFDDWAVEDWAAQRDLFARHHAHVTFFVTYLDRMTDAQLQLLHDLADDGHAIEAHTVHHYAARGYVEQHGVKAYLEDEILPSLRALWTHDFSPTSFAYPFGQDVPDLDPIMLDAGVRTVRVGIGACPYARPHPDRY